MGSMGQGYLQTHTMKPLLIFIILVFLITDNMSTKSTEQNSPLDEDLHTKTKDIWESLTFTKDVLENWNYKNLTYIQSTMSKYQDPTLPEESEGSHSGKSRRVLSFTALIIITAFFLGGYILIVVISALWNKSVEDPEVGGHRNLGFQGDTNREETMNGMGEYAEYAGVYRGYIVREQSMEEPGRDVREGRENMRENYTLYKGCRGNEDRGLPSYSLYMSEEGLPSYEEAIKNSAKLPD